MKEKIFRLFTENGSAVVSEEVKADVSVRLNELRGTDERGILFSYSECSWEMYQKGVRADFELFAEKVGEMYNSFSETAEQSATAYRKFLEQNRITPPPVFKKGDTVWYGIEFDLPVERKGKVVSIISKDYIGVKDSKSGAVSFYKPTEIFTDYELALAYKEQLLMEKAEELAYGIKTPHELIAFVRKEKKGKLPDFIIDEIIEKKSEEFGIGE